MSKKKKTRKNRGRKTGHGHKKKHRGAGSRGGRGKAGFQNHKKTWADKYAPDKFGKSKLKPKEPKLEVINLDQIRDIALRKSKKELSFPGYKILGRGNLGKKLKIRANSFSASARNKIKEAGGEAEVIEESGKESNKSAESEE